MQQHHFAYDELTPLEQCILEFMAKKKDFRKPQRSTPPKQQEENA